MTALSVRVTHFVGCLLRTTMPGVGLSLVSAMLSYLLPSLVVDRRRCSLVRRRYFEPITRRADFTHRRLCCFSLSHVGFTFVTTVNSFDYIAKRPWQKLFFESFKDVVFQRLGVHLISNSF